MVGRADRHALRDSAMEASLCHHDTLVSILIFIILAFDFEINAQASMSCCLRMRSFL